MFKKGLIFNIEGIDCTGKQTQSILLKENLEKLGYKVKLISFPNYKSESSTLVKLYLKGELGNNAEDINPYTASSFYAVDRVVTWKKELENYYKNGYILIFDRYVYSNIIHQASKLAAEEKEKFLKWIYDYEFNLLNLPIPDEIFFLNIPLEESIKLNKFRKNKITDNSKKDIHERNINYLKKSYVNSIEMAKKYNFKIIDCIDKNKNLKSPIEISLELLESVKKKL